jgi:hypothetical protein
MQISPHHLLQMCTSVLISLAYGLGVDSASNRYEYQESSWGCKGRPAHKADNLTTICELTVWKKCGSLNDSEP